MKISFIGIGKMGEAIVERLLTKGYEVTVYNRTYAKVLPLVALGANSSPSISQAVQSANIVFSCVFDDGALSSVTSEMLQSLPANSIHISLSTVLPDTAKKINDLHCNHGSYYISAAVLGIPKVASEGNLTTICAGEDVALERVLPILNDMSCSVISLGNQINLPNVFKICINYSTAITLQLISELYVFAEKSGLETEFVQEALHQIYLHPAIKYYIDKIHDKRFDEVNFDIMGGNKDVTLFQNAFNNVGVVPGLANIVKSSFSDALAKGMQNKDWSAIYEVIRSQAGLH